VSPDGRYVACTRERHGTEEVSVKLELWVIDLATGEGRALGNDLFPAAIAWAPSSEEIFFSADHQGRRPVFRAELRTGTVTRFTPDDGSYLELCPAPDGSEHAGSVYALRSAVDSPPT